MTACISIAANHIPYNSAHTPKVAEPSLALGVMLQAGNRWPAGGEKKLKKVCLRRAEKILSRPLLLLPFLLPSSLASLLKGKGREYDCFGA